MNMELLALHFRTCVSGFNPRWEESPFISLIPEILVKVGVCDLLQWLNIINWHQVGVQIHELNTNLTGRGF